MSHKPRRIEPEIFIEGIDVVIRLDLGKHRELLTQSQTDLTAFNEAVTHESAKKRHYYKQIGKGQFDDDALNKSIGQMRINIRHLSDKAKLAQDKIEHHMLIVDTLTKQLREYNTVSASVKRSCHS